VKFSSITIGNSGASPSTKPPLYSLSLGIYKFKYAILEAVRKVFDYKSIYEKVRFKDSEYSGGFVEGDAPEFKNGIFKFINTF
jgi:hypothetical protein